MTEQDSELAAVLRREAEQLLAQTGGTYSNQGQSVTFDVRPLLREVEVFLKAFARRQRAQALESAADEIDGMPVLSDAAVSDREDAGGTHPPDKAGCTGPRRAPVETVGTYEPNQRYSMPAEAVPSAPAGLRARAEALLPTGGHPCAECGGQEFAVLCAGGGGWSATARHEHVASCSALRCPHGVLWADDCEACNADQAEDTP